MDLKCVHLLLAIVASVNLVCGSSVEEAIFDRGYKSLYRIYDECQHRNGGISPCLKKKAITFFDRLGRIDNLPITENFQLVKIPGVNNTYTQPGDIDNVGRAGASRDEVLTDILLERISNLLNGFNLQMSLPRTSSGELKQGVVEGRGKMKKMMGMMVMGMGMKMAALVPIAMGVLFLLAGKALIISKIALVLSMIIGLKKLLSQKQGGDSHGGWQSSGGGGGGGGWDRSLKGGQEIQQNHSTQEYAQNLAYSAQKPQQL